MMLTRLRMKGAPLADIRVVEFDEDRLPIILVDVKDTMTVFRLTVKNVLVLQKLLLRKALWDFGIKGIREDEINIMTVIDPQLHRAGSYKAKRYTTFAKIPNGLLNPGVRPEGQLVCISVDVKGESFFGHIRRVRRNIVRHRRLKQMRCTGLGGPQAKKEPAADAQSTLQEQTH